MRRARASYDGIIVRGQGIGHVLDEEDGAYGSDVSSETLKYYPSLDIGCHRCPIRWPIYERSNPPTLHEDAAHGVAKYNISDLHFAKEEYPFKYVCWVSLTEKSNVYRLAFQ